MYQWNETLAHRGANEICSCLYKYVTTHFGVLQNGQKRDLVIWTDRCVGQNNNIFLLLTMMKLVRQKIITSFNHKLFLTGHSYNDCDRDFSQLEKKQRVYTVLIPAELENVIRESRVDNPFNMVWMTQNDFFDFKQLLNFLEGLLLYKLRSITGFSMMLYKIQ